MADPTRLDECLSIREGRLFVEGCDAVELTRRFGSPLFVLSEDQLRRNLRRFREAFRRGWPHGPVQVLPAAKANWLQAALRVVADEGAGCDVYSPGELSAALAAGIDPAAISVNGTPKDEAHVRRTVEAGARLTLDGVEEVDHLERAVRDTGRTARVRLRLRPAMDFGRHSDFVAEGLFPTDLSALVYKGGLSLDEVLAVGRRLRAVPGVEIVGFHQHHGRHSASAAYWAAQMEAYARDVGTVCRELGGLRPREIDVGGGFAIRRDPFNRATRYGEPAELLAFHGLARLLRWLGTALRFRAMARLMDTVVCRPNQRLAPSVEEYAAAVTGALGRALPRHGVDPAGVTLQVEPGRSLFGDCGVHLATVRALKRMTRPVRWRHVVVDTTEFWLTGGRYEHHLHAYLFANKADAPMTGRADVLGRSCYGDRILPTVPVPAGVEVGDVLAILDTGAYQEVSASNFNALPRPATVLVTGGQAEVVRRAETQEDVFRRDVVPERLGRPVARA